MGSSSRFRVPSAAKMLGSDRIGASSMANAAPCFVKEKSSPARFTALISSARTSRNSKASQPRIRGNRRKPSVRSRI